MNAVRTEIRSLHRLWVRERNPTRPFLWGGLLPVIALLLLLAYAFGPFAHLDIESAVRGKARSLLDTHSASWVQLGVSGQDVQLSGVEPQPGAGAAALALVRQGLCDSWIAALTCAVEVRGRFDSPPAPTPAPTAPVVAAASAAAVCERSLADLLQGRRIEFASGSAVLEAGSAGLLDALASAARQCPGIIRVEGYTDSTGSAVANRTLSEARAQAVRTALAGRGIPVERLQAAGFGADKPLQDNSTPAGREANRRIEFHVVATP